jgi:DNA polymerase-3 subunit gamma/tau
MGKALYRKYRSKSLDEIVGQKHVTDILSRSLKQGKIAHAYLLTGPRGVGKTSIARILAHEINQLPYSDESSHLDIIEIDAASNNGVDDVRDLREKVQIAPVSAAKKVYIIDEVHMLSKAAFNALLKTLEEPPEHVVFILATTDVDKLPPTIISRTQRFGFRSISRDDAVAHLRSIADQEKIKIDDESLAILAERGEGSFRDSISLLDQLSSLADEKTGITPDLVEATLGLAPRKSVQALLAAVTAKDSAAIVTLLDEFEKSGVQASVLTSQLIATVRANIAEHPQLIALLDNLLDVNKSSHPSVKLLTTLVSFATPKPKSAALSAPLPSVSAPVESLKKAQPKAPAASEAMSSSAGLSKRPASAETLSSRDEDHPNAMRATNGSSADAEESGDAEAGRAATRPAELDMPSSEHAAQESVNTNPGPKKSSAPGELDWPKLVEHVRANHIALYSVLSKCGHELDGDLLRIYTITPFYKKKLDDAKYRPQLAQALIETGAGDLTIDTIPTAPPPKDSQAAAVAAIMGGGEEVNL